MSDKRTDGGPAYPFEQVKERERGAPTEWINYKGMSLRDYLAAQAMQGILAAQIYGFNDQLANGPFAKMAYKMADAMLEEREK